MPPDFADWFAAHIDEGGGLSSVTVGAEDVFRTPPECARAHSP